MLYNQYKQALKYYAGNLQRISFFLFSFFNTILVYRRFKVVMFCLRSGLPNGCYVTLRATSPCRPQRHFVLTSHL